MPRRRTSTQRVRRTSSRRTSSMYSPRRRLSGGAESPIDGDAINSLSTLTASMSPLTRAGIVAATAGVIAAWNYWLNSAPAPAPAPDPTPKRVEEPNVVDPMLENPPPKSWMYYTRDGKTMDRFRTPYIYLDTDKYDRLIVSSGNDPDELTERKNKIGGLKNDQYYIIAKGSGILRDVDGNDKYSICEDEYYAIPHQSHFHERAKFPKARM